MEQLTFDSLFERTASRIERHGGGDQTNMTYIVYVKDNEIIFPGSVWKEPCEILSHYGKDVFVCRIQRHSVWDASVRKYRHIPAKYLLIQTFENNGYTLGLIVNQCEPGHRWAMALRHLRQSAEGLARRLQEQTA